MTPTLPLVPPDVAAFAEERGVSHYLPDVLRLARRLFPSEPMSVSLYQDCDVAELRWILIRVLVPVETDFSLSVRPRQDEWTQGLFTVCPASHAHAFGFSAEAVA